MLNNIEWREIMEEQSKVFEDDYTSANFEDPEQWDEALRELEETKN